MNVNTRLKLNDVLCAHKQLVAFLCDHAIFCLVAAMCGLAIAQIPASMFPLKLAVNALALSLFCCVVITLYRTASWRDILDEVRHQSQWLLPSALLVISLSIAGYLLSEWLLNAFSNELAQISHHAGNAAKPKPSAWISAVTLSLVMCAVLILPFVLAHFCNGLGLAHQQGERIWKRLLCNGMSLAGFLPFVIAFPVLDAFVPTLIPMAILLSGGYCTFLLFIVFDIPQAPRQRESNRHCADAATQV